MYSPGTDEYAEYYGRYVSYVSDTDIPAAYARQPDELRAAHAAIDESRGTYTYEAGKWTIKEALSHLIDAERIFAYRMLRISRGDVTPIEGFEQDGYIENSNANTRTIADLLDEFELARRSNVLMLSHMGSEGLARMGTASGFPVSVRALLNISIGHVRHHLGILNERYLTNGNAAAGS